MTDRKRPLATALQRQAERQRLAGVIRRARRALDLSQWELARRAGGTQSRITKAEHARPVSAAHMRRILRALVDLDRERNG